MKKILVLSICILSCLSSVGQNTKMNVPPPSWVKGYFKELTNSYIEVVSSSGYDLKNARESAINEAISRRSLASGTQANVSIAQGDIQVLSGHDVIVKARIVDEYILHDSMGYKVWLLVQTAKNPSLEYEPVSVSENYAFSALSFLPGAAQFNKGSNLKGALILGGEVAFIGGAIACNMLSKQNYNKGQATKDAKLRTQYTNTANAYATAQYISLAGAVAVYVWNVIDGITAKGKKHVVTGNAALAAIPYYGPEGMGVGVSLAYRF